MATDFLILPLAFPPTGKLELKRIKELTFNGLHGWPSEDRALSWLILLEVFPPNPSNWADYCDQKTKQYQSFISLFELDNWISLHIPPHTKSNEYPVKEKDLMTLIHGDVCRTVRQFRHLPEKPIAGAPSDDEFEYMKYEVYMRQMERILYIYASFNRGHQYIQGFNELIQPFFYVFSKSFSLFPDILQVEAFTFYCFSSLLSQPDVSALFTTQDDSSILLHQLAGFDKILEEYAPKQFELLKRNNIQNILFCYRWFSLLFSQEFDIPDLLLVWDCLFVNLSEIIDFCFYIGVAFIQLKENDIISKPYYDIISALQNMNRLNVIEILQRTKIIWNSEEPSKRKHFFQYVGSFFHGVSQKIKNISQL